MNTYRLIWAPEGKTIAVVEARNPKSARRKAPKPYRKYLGEIGVELTSGIYHAKYAVDMMPPKQCK